MGKLLTLEGYDNSYNDEYIGWGMPSVSIPKPDFSSITSSISSSLSTVRDTVKNQVNTAVAAAKQHAQEQLERVKQAAADEMADLKDNLKNEFKNEILLAKEKLESELREKWELSKELKFSQAYNELAKDISYQTLQDYGRERYAALYDKMILAGKEYAKTQLDKVKDKIKTDLKAEIKELLIKGYMKVTGQEMPDIDVAAETARALERINQVLRSPIFTSLVMNKVSTELSYEPQKFTKEFLEYGIGDITNIGEKLESVIQEFPPESIYYILECINYVTTILSQYGDYIVQNQDRSDNELAHAIVEQTTYIPSDDPYAELKSQSATIQSSMPDLPSPEEMKIKSVGPSTNKNMMMYAGIAAGVLALIFFMKK